MSKLLRELQIMQVRYMRFIVRLVSEPDHSHGEEGSGNMPTFALSPGRNADLTKL